MAIYLVVKKYMLSVPLVFNTILSEALNAKDAEKMRNGFRLGISNSRGVHSVDPTGKLKLELAANYKQKADAVENAGYQRFAATLRGRADSYARKGAENYRRSRR